MCRPCRRDFVLLAMMFNTGARVQEILDLRPCDLQLERPFQVRLFGKGRKERTYPLWPQTAQLLRAFLTETGIEGDRNFKGPKLPGTTRTWTQGADKVGPPQRPRGLQGACKIVMQCTA
ncbi:MAG: tyrosine-type recombinase/integrase [Holophaga sp.]